MTKRGESKQEKRGNGRLTEHEDLTNTNWTSHEQMNGMYCGFNQANSI